jgi:nucleotide-binding universal stress UspA family protein
MYPPSLDGFLANDGDTSAGLPHVAGQLDGDQILVPLLTREHPALIDQLKVATALARVTGASLTVINPVCAPARTPSEYHHEASDSDDADLLKWVFDQTADPLPQVNGDCVYTRGVVTGVLRAVRARDVDTLVVPGGVREGRLRTGITERIAAHADADVVVANGQAGFKTPASILLPIAGGPHSGLAADVAATIADDADAWIDVVHIVDEDAPDQRRDDAEALAENVAQRIARPDTTTTWILETATDLTTTIIDQSRCYDLTVIGAPTKGRLQKFIFGSTTQSVRKNAGSAVLSARSNSRR